MNDRWKNFSSLWWPSPVGANLGFPVAPAPRLGELWNGSLPPMTQTSWALPTPTPPAPPRGGLFSSFDAGRTGGILGQLAPPAEHLNSARYWGATTVPASMSVGPMPLGDYFLAPVPRVAAWDAAPSRAPATTARALPEPRNRSSWEVSARNSNVGPSTNSSAGGVQDGWEIISDATPDNDWIPNARYVGDGHHHAPQAIYEKLPLPKETRRVFRKGITGRLPFFGWHQNDRLHREYSDAVEELMNRFLQEHNIKPEQMNVDALSPP